MAGAPLKYGAAGAPQPRFARGVRTRSYDALNSQAVVSHGSIDSAALPARTAKQVATPLPKTNGKARPVSRLELLLVSRSSKAVFTPDESSTESQAINTAIEMSAQWTDVQEAILNAPALSFNNLAFAVYRLGCIAVFDSKKRKNDLKASNLVPQLFELAMARIDRMDPASLVLLLDGCARLEHTPSLNDLAKIADLIRQHVSDLEARQLSLVLWAFSSLTYQPRSEVLAALEGAISSKACDLPPQGVTLVLTSFQAAEHVLNQSTLTRLADVIQRKLLLFKPSELATSLKTLHAAGFRPTHDFVEALKEMTGQSALNQGLSSLSVGYNLSLVS